MNLKHSSQLQSWQNKCVKSVLSFQLTNVSFIFPSQTFMPQYTLVLTALTMFKQGIATSWEGRGKHKKTYSQPILHDYIFPVSLTNVKTICCKILHFLLCHGQWWPWQNLAWLNTSVLGRAQGASIHGCMDHAVQLMCFAFKRGWEGISNVEEAMF